MDVPELFEAELRRRGLDFRIDPESGRYVVAVEDWQMFVSLDNLQRDIDNDGDRQRIVRFVDTVLATGRVSDSRLSADRLYWCLESNEYHEKAEYHIAVSNRIDRVLVHLSDDGRCITWVTAEMLTALQLTPEEASHRAFRNLGRALLKAMLHIKMVDGVRLGFFRSTLPFKSALLLAPNRKTVLERRLGWPLLAVAPDRDFLYLWPAADLEFTGRLGPVVISEHARSSYPLSTEVFALSEQGIEAIGAFEEKP